MRLNCFWWKTAFELVDSCRTLSDPPGIQLWLREGRTRDRLKRSLKIGGERCRKGCADGEISISLFCWSMVTFNYFVYWSWHLIWDWFVFDGRWQLIILRRTLMAHGVRSRWLSWRIAMIAFYVDQSWDIRSCWSWWMMSKFGYVGWSRKILIK